MHHVTVGPDSSYLREKPNRESSRKKHTELFPPMASPVSEADKKSSNGGANSLPAAARVVRATVVQASSVFYDTPATMGLLLLLLLFRSLLSAHARKC